MTEILRTAGLERSFQDGNRTIEVLRGIDFRLRRGERVAIVGPSGSGKSTFLHLCGLLDTPTGGVIYLEGTPMTELSDRERSRVRNKKFGFVFQGYHLLPEFTATENVLLPGLMNAGGPRLWNRSAVVERARELLVSVGLGERLHARPATLSGGEKQRVAIARALINEPEVLYCDEPTGNLDTRTSLEIFALLERLHKERPYSAIIVTHEMELAKRCDRIVRLEGGVLHEQG